MARNPRSKKRVAHSGSFGKSRIKCKRHNIGGKSYLFAEEEIFPYPSFHLTPLPLVTRARGIYRKPMSSGSSEI